MMQAKEFVGDEFHAFCQREYDAARRFLKTCGKPADEYARAEISINKETAAIFGGFLSVSEKAEELRKAEEFRKNYERFHGKAVAIA